MSFEVRYGVYYIGSVADEYCFGLRLQLGLVGKEAFSDAPELPDEVVGGFLNPERAILYERERSLRTQSETWAQMDGSTMRVAMRLSLEIKSSLGPSVCAMHLNMTYTDVLQELPLAADWAALGPAAGSQGVSPALAAGVASGCLALVIGAVVLMVFLRRRRHRKAPLFPKDTVETLLGEALQRLFDDSHELGRPVRPMAWNSTFNGRAAGGGGAGERGEPRAGGNSPAVSAKQLLLDVDRCRVGEEIGRGNFGTVHRGLLDQATPVAIKTFSVLQVGGKGGGWQRWTG